MSFPSFADIILTEDMLEIPEIFKIAVQNEGLSGQITVDCEAKRCWASFWSYSDEVEDGLVNFLNKLDPGDAIICQGEYHCNTRTEILQAFENSHKQQ